MSAAMPLIPLDVLFGNPERISPTISPDGSRFAFVAPDDGVLNVWVGPADQGLDAAQPVTSDRDRGIRSYFWSPRGDQILYIQDAGGDENWRLYSLDLAGGQTIDLTPFDDVAAQVVAVDHRHPDEILVGLNKNNPELHDVYRLDLTTHELDLIVENPGFIGWEVDESFVVRAGAAPTPDGGMVIMVRDDPDSSDWRPLLEIGQEDALGTATLGFSADGSKLLAVSSVGANAAQFVEIDVTSGDATVITGDDTYDVGGVLFERDTQRPLMVWYVKDRVDFEPLDAELADELEALRAVHDGDLMITSRTRADDVWIIGFNSDTGPVPYYRWDRASRSATLLFHHQPKLAAYDLAPMEPFSFTSRDGLTVHGYLTYPLGAERNGLPTLLNVHGGPWARDTWGYNPEAQFFANRGYLCVQVNYRGSTGFGKDFVNAGDREWAGRMHDDLLDAIEHLLELGHVDADRIGIYGGSYGGYAALVGATFTPDRFACAIDVVGPSNLKTLIESIPPYWAPMIAQFHTRVGNPETEEDFLWERSPLSRADEIKIPMLIAQGANDPRVKQAESEQIVDAMVAAGIPHEYLLYEDEGHGFAKPANRLDFYSHAERFLANHLAS